MIGQHIIRLKKRDHINKNKQAVIKKQLHELQKYMIGDNIRIICITVFNMSGKSIREFRGIFQLVLVDELVR